jgi:hypothetical protein
MQTPALYSLIYMSVATEGLQQEEIDAIVAQSRFNNKLDDITGCLAYIEGQSRQEQHRKFIQVLEGEEHKIADLFQRIQKDRRHTNVSLVVHGPIKTRNFASWEMRFEKINLDLSPSFSGFFELDPLILAEQADINNHMLLDFMKSFCKAM